MPELPEVETVMRGLAPSMTGAVITNAHVNRPNLRWPFPENMADRLTGQRVERLTRRSKYILATLNGGETLLIHLGMSGRILVSGDPLGQFVHDHPAQQKHDHVVLEFDNGARVTFNDPRRFGAMDLIETAELDDHPLLKVLGPEPFSNSFNESYLGQRISNKKSPIKSVLLDQSVVAGLGNIYVCEVLYKTGIHPARLANDISPQETAKLIPTIRTVLEAAIQAGGSSLRDFRQADGELGYFQHSFDVYGREQEKCKNTECSSKIERLVQSGRSSFFCPSCQR
jgi:formamidopyrimidine-DNA glycosylase